MQTEKPPIGYINNVLRLQCPRCRKGKIFKNKLSLGISKNVEMQINCPTCNQPTEIEVGFYYGTGYVSYGITVVLIAVSFVMWLVTIGFSVEDNRIFWWLGITSVSLLLLQPWLMRISRALWLSWFVKYNANWKTNQNFDKERIVANQMEGVQNINKEILE
jgi:endogenous inhibitor of DNA gyrase (YacG/DUF329 family)